MRRRGTHNDQTSLEAGDWLLGLCGVSMRWLRRFARRQVGEQDADDLVQRTLTRILTHSSSSEVRSPRALVATVARNLAVDTARHSKARGGNALAFEDLDARIAPTIAPEQDSVLLLKQVILSLPPIYRDTFVLNRFIGLTYVEIAQRYGITTKAVEYRMSRALALCAEALKD